MRDAKAAVAARPFRVGARLAELSPAIWIVALTLAVLPTLDAPFSTPKALLLALASGAFAPWALVRPARKVNRLLATCAFAWIAAAALATLLDHDGRLPELLLIAGTGASVLGLASLDWDADAVELAISLSGGALGLVVLLQWAGCDPFQLAGLMPALPGSRMRLYGTLGNPDFVAGFLVPSLCVTLGRMAAASPWRAKRLREGSSVPWREAASFRGLGWIAVALLQAAALTVIGSFATLLAVGAATLLFAFVRLREFSRWGIPGAVLLLALLAWGVQGRNLGHAAKGRLYLWEVAAPHWTEAPWIGFGPGSILGNWPKWQSEFRARHPGADPSFEQLQDHTHDDYLEALLDTGLAGAIPFVGLIACALFLGMRMGRLDPGALAATCAIAAFAARALVDFPFHRPAELGLFALLVARAIANRSPAVSHRSPPCRRDVSAPPSCSPAPPVSC